MKIFLISLLILVIFITAAVFGLKYWQSQSQKGNAPITLEQTLTGVLQSAPGNLEYSDVLVSGSTQTPVSSSTLNLKPYEGRNVKIMGQYSGNTLYADSISVHQ